jgi:hypothetical protein
VSSISKLQRLRSTLLTFQGAVNRTIARRCYLTIACIDQEGIIMKVIEKSSVVAEVVTSTTIGNPDTISMRGEQDWQNVQTGHNRRNHHNQQK